MLWRNCCNAAFAECAYLLRFYIFCHLKKKIECIRKLPTYFPAKFIIIIDHAGVCKMLKKLLIDDCLTLLTTDWIGNKIKSEEPLLL